MKMLTTWSLGIAVLSLAFFSCKKNDDSSTNPINNPANNDPPKTEVLLEAKKGGTTVATLAGTMDGSVATPSNFAATGAFNKAANLFVVNVISLGSLDFGFGYTTSMNMLSAGDYDMTPGGIVSATFRHKDLGSQGGTAYQATSGTFAISKVANYGMASGVTLNYIEATVNMEAENPSDPSDKITVTGSIKGLYVPAQ